MDLADACAMAEDLLEHHGLHDWSVVFDSAKRRAGVCRFGPKVIGLSAPVTSVHGYDEVRDTVLHEVAHALAGPRHGHDATWRRIAVSIGCSGERCVSDDAPRVEAPWMGVCPAGHTVDRHRRPERVMTCSRCRPSFDLAHLLTWTHHGRPAQMHPNYLAELDRVRRGEPTVLLPPGVKVRITVEGEHSGRVGRIVKRGRTSYHVRAGRGVLRVPFAWVEPVQRGPYR